MDSIGRIKEFEAYKSVIALADEKKITINITIQKIEDGNELGYTKYEPHHKKINIVIKDSETNRDEVFIHELLHAKLILIGYPHVQFYSLINMHPFIHQVMGSLINSVEHTFVFSEMRTLGYNQEEIDNKFIERIIQISETQSEGVAKLSHAVNFLELYLRSPKAMEEYKQGFSIKQGEAFTLFLEMKRIVDNINSPLSMREAYSKLFKLINEFIFNKSGENLFLNTVLSVSPVFEEELHNQLASDVVYTVKIQGYPHVFVLDKKNKQCCLFLSNQGGNIETDQVDSILREHSVKKIFSL